MQGWGVFKKMGSTSGTLVCACIYTWGGREVQVGHVEEDPTSSTLVFVWLGGKGGVGAARAALRAQTCARTN